MTTASPSYFADAHANRRDITDSYLALGDIPDLVGISLDNDDRIISEMRRKLEGDGGGIEKIHALAALHALASPNLPAADALYHDNKVAAIDGTNAVSPLRFVSDTIYAVGAVAVTPQSPNSPRVRVTRTRATSYAAKQDFSVPWEVAFKDWGKYLQGAREQEISWVNTFREYEERELADEWLRGDPERIALIDGPVVTQNLMTQNEGRSLLESLIRTGRAIGFIKDLSANARLAAIGYALQTGEAFVITGWPNLLTERFSTTGQENIADWVGIEAKDVVRAIYKINRRAYGVECVLPQVPLAFALLEHDPGGTAEHDIPMLLQIADARVRGGFNGDAARDEVRARYGVQDPDRLVQLVGERELR